MPFYQQWNIAPWDVLFIKEAILMGVGWWQYQNKVNFYTRKFLNIALSKKYSHSVRDSYTEEKLKKIGMMNIINTGCPTMWGLNTEHCKKIPHKKSNSVIFTLTDYSKNPEVDAEIVRVLKNNYENIYLWLQGSKDYRYLKELGVEHLFDKLIPPVLSAYDEALQIDCDYVGTRLHAGIRAIQMGRRALVLAVDNRGVEKGRDFGLPVLPREKYSLLAGYINDSFPTMIKINQNNIDDWIGQF
jgi:polysaccharide pyruvyl transferase WcaK-like protein